MVREGQHEVVVIGRHATHGYLLLLNHGMEGKEYKLPGKKFAQPGKKFVQKKGEEYYDAAKLAAVRVMLQQTGLKVAPRRLQRVRFPAQVQEKLGNKVFFEVALHDEDSLSVGTTALSGEPEFLLQLDESFGFTFHRDLRHAAAAVSSRTMAKALLATEAIYSADNCCLLGILKLFSWWS
ncbi:unnamed protein product [Durusdinium trenchii]|uniref:Nudix hydrolase domain-containing protein n=2 Tax=Durusdinium trenchii TaxID=1381693 RepID=A0ABP0I3X6_9DINO